jgi:hypothetical protein
MNWLLHNKEWIFSGIGVFVLGLVITFFNKPARRRKIKQRQKSGANSTNIQVGGDYKHGK